ncbi:GDA1/CD39 (nucleoside phosphatase) family protein [Besnoitia besnoiti]|uniref:GDA1/CD39 (Nucleoside phosphatase) family protein n=1 Tax=Besnoitia besnoiti TaxID=94643 RepID=A0A2A9M6Z7_BESBE|nr:GDA1/CD39 (nucleoside phosphatase) family protein [Besnoitia besnoiti]PFH31407.1 GDA1/CD39 (nucleoside phosphatase) family protein [Besnoitia besnoiti]
MPRGGRIHPREPYFSPARQRRGGVICFESFDQVFKFASSSSPMVITGGAMYADISPLQGLGLPFSDFRGSAHELSEAARKFCRGTVGSSPSVPVVRVAEADEKLNGLKCDLCKTLALTASLLAHMEKGEHRPLPSRGRKHQQARRQTARGTWLACGRHPPTSLVHREVGSRCL